MRPVSTLAQSSAGSGFSSEETKAVAAALAELEGRRKEVEALKAALGAKNEQVQALEAIVAQQEKIIAEWKASAEARREANESDAKIKASYEASVKAYEAQLAEMRHDRDKWRSRFTKLATGVGIVVLTVLGVAAANN